MALFRVRTRIGWVNLCRRHYDAHFLGVARQYCEARGLTSWQEQRNAVFIGLKEYLERTVMSR